MYMSSAQSWGRMSADSAARPVASQGIGFRHSRFLPTEPVGHEDQVGLYAYVGNDPVNLRDPTGECRNRDDDGECIVTNNAGEDGAQATADLQSSVRATDHAIQAIGDNQSVSVSFNGGRPQTMTGGELKESWSQTTWTIDPAGTLYDNGMGGQINSRGDARFALDKFVEFQTIHVARGGTAGNAVSTLILHELSHVTKIGRAIRSRLWRDRDFDERERRTSATGAAIGSRIGRPFKCDVFFLGCSR